MKNILPIQKEHLVNVEINGTSFSIDAGLSLSDVLKISYSKEKDSDRIIAATIVSKINEKYNTSFTEEQVLSEAESILPIFLKQVPHLQDSSAGFKTAEELVNQARDSITKMNSKLPKTPEYSSLFMPSPEKIKMIGENLRYEQERKLEEFRVRESANETAANTSELLSEIVEMKAENKKAARKQCFINWISISIGLLTLIATIVFGIKNRRDNSNSMLTNDSLYEESELLFEESNDEHPIMILESGFDVEAPALQEEKKDDEEMITVIEQQPVIQTEPISDGGE